MQTSTCGLIIGTLIAFVGAGAATADDATAILAKMRENDARFDGVRLKEKRTWQGVLKPRPPRIFLIDQKQPKQPADYWEQVDYDGLAHEEFIVKGKKRVFTADFDESMNEADKYKRIGTGLTRTGDFGSVVYRYDNMQLPDGDASKKTRNYERQLRIQPFKFELGALYDTMLGREFAHGIGFGRRIKEIASCEPIEEGHRLKGRITIWLEDVSTFEIEVDRHGLVRNATIDCDVKGNKTRFVTTSEGLVKSGGLKLAKRGHFERLRVPRPVKVDQRPTVSQEYDLELVSIATGIDDKLFEELSRFDLEPLMQYDDFVGKVNGTCIEQADGTVALRLRNRKIQTEVTDYRGL